MFNISAGQKNNIILQKYKPGKFLGNKIWLSQYKLFRSKIKYSLNLQLYTVNWFKINLMTYMNGDKSLDLLANTVMFSILIFQISFWFRTYPVRCDRLWRVCTKSHRCVSTSTPAVRTQSWQSTVPACRLGTTWPLTPVYTPSTAVSILSPSQLLTSLASRNSLSSNSVSKWMEIWINQSPHILYYL